jgi:signal transduction histidine kinase
LHITQEFWWAFGIGSVTLLVLGIGYIWNIVANQRRSIASRERQLKQLQEREEKLRASQQQLRSLTARLQSVREEERLNIAREVHDDLGQVLTVVKIRLKDLSNNLKSKRRIGVSEMLSSLKSLTKLVDGSINMVKEISSELRPIVLDNLGLKEAFEWESHKLQERGKIACSIDFYSEGISFSKEQQIGIFRIYQEALTNVLRHSCATKVQTTVRMDDKGIRMQVLDNGTGIPEAAINNPKSLGLLGMKERALLLNGELTISCTNGTGTVVSLTIPGTQPEVRKGFNPEYGGEYRD